MPLPPLTPTIPPLIPGPTSWYQNTMSRDSCHQAYPILGFSVSQPALGCPLEFFPAMGSQELDDMIHAYVPGPNSILDKRAAVSMEFFNHNLQTGELFKFFMVYQNASATTSPASSSGMIDSGYGSSFNTSPVISESQWSQSTSSSSTKARKSSKTSSSVSRPQDFSHIPGFSIMTKDGQDVTHSASRGMKTKEQRDHAHLMRVIKACESCRKKKTRCDPSHKKRTSVASSASESSARASKKSKKTTSTVAPSISSAKAQSMLAPSQSASAMATESLLFDITSSADEATAESWEQFVQFDGPLAATAAPNDWEHFFDTAGYYSPSASHTNSTPMSPSQVLQTSVPATPAGLEFVDSGLRGPGFSQEPIVPYLNPGGLGDAGSNYVDFNLYSPGSTCLDDDPDFTRDVTASRHGLTASPLSQRHPSVDRQPESIGTLQSTASPSQRHPSIVRQPESIGTLQSMASPSQWHAESIGTLQSLVTGSASQSLSESNAPVSERRSRSQEHAFAGLRASADRILSPQPEVDQTIDRGNKSQRPQSDLSERQSPVLITQDNSGAVSAGLTMSSGQNGVPARGALRSHGFNGGAVIHSLQVTDVRNHGYGHSDAQEVDVQDLRQETVQDRRQSSSVDNIALTSGGLGSQIPRPSPAVERARAVPKIEQAYDQHRQDNQALATQAIQACSAGEHYGTATCLQSMAALVQGAAILAVLATFVGQLSTWWPQRESKGSWRASPHALPPVASPPSSERPSSVSGTKKATSAVRPLLSTAPLSGDNAGNTASQLRKAAAVFQNRMASWTGRSIHRGPLAVMG